MSTGENMNANGANLSQSMIHAGLGKFPQSTTAMVHPTQAAVLAGINFPVHPWGVKISAAVPPTEVHFVGTDGVLLGRIVGLGIGGSAVPHITQDDALDFVDKEHQGGLAHTVLQQQRRLKDGLL